MLPSLPPVHQEGKTHIHGIHVYGHVGAFISIRGEDSMCSHILGGGGDAAVQG